MKRWLAILGALYLLLAAGFNLATPYGEAPDEWAHVDYVKQVAAGRLPHLDLLTRKDRQTGYEAHQPPLYYALCVPVWKAATALGAREAAAAKWVRIISILLGGLGLLAIWGLAGEASGWTDPRVPLLATGFAAFLPMRLAVCAAVTNDPLAELVATLALWVMVTIVRGGVTVRRVLLLGILLGTGLLTKMSLVILFPVAALALLLGSRRREKREAAASRKKRRAPAPRTSEWLTLDGATFARGLAISFGVALAIGGPWLARNYVLYGDPLANRAFTWYFADTRRYEWFREQGVDFFTYLGQLVLPVTFDSFWGAFGHLNRPELFMGALNRDYPPTSWVYPILLMATLAAVAGCVVWYLRARRQATAEGVAVGLVLGLATALVVASFLRFNTVFFQAQGRYLFLALGPISLAMAGGWLQLTPKRWWWYTAAGGGVLMLALALYALFGVVVPGFARA
ncbi:MAG: glycosyltransferase family 39 protein [Armatimonadetes bacterium]|nr:glycosyltransferase family 39 protein [Armatimonadota bacterium]